METNEVMKVDSSALVIARSRAEMQAANASIATWLRNKVDGLKADAIELSEAVAEAKLHKWKHSTLQSRLNRELATIKYYEKAIAAVDAGFTIIPEFPIEVFAVRVRSEKFKTEMHSLTGYSHPRAPEVKPGKLLEGEGEYKSTTPSVTEWSQKEDFKNASGQMEKRDRNFIETHDYQDVVFPLIAAKPAIMSATAEAMSLRLFDEIGICPRSRQADPMIIGTIVGPKVGWTEKRLHFLIMWFLDKRTL